jgi:folate-binding protein YgfZ
LTDRIDYRLDIQMHKHSGRLLHLGLLRFSGADRFTFLQGQLSNDTRRLAAGKPLLAAYCNTQGRVVAVMHLLPHSSGVVAILPRELVLPTREQLRKFVLRATVQIEDAGERLAVAGQHGEDAIRAAGLPVPQQAIGYLEVEGIGIGRVNADAGRYWIIGESARLAGLGLGGNVADAEQIESDWKLADVHAGLPQVYALTRELFVAQMLNLDLLDGISFTKGCFTGQEIIARTQHRGRIKRRLFRLRLPPGDFGVGQAVTLGDGRSGRVTELARTAEGFEALAVLNVEAAAGEAESATPAPARAQPAVAATLLPLPYDQSPPPA